MGVNAMSLSTEYMGLKLKNPIVVAAGPWSRDGASIQRSIDAGASAVVTETSEPAKDPAVEISADDAKEAEEAAVAVTDEVAEAVEPL